MLRIRVTLLGKSVYCQHCHGRFVAADASMGPAPAAEGRLSDSMVEDLIERAEAMLQQSAATAPADTSDWTA